MATPHLQDPGGLADRVRENVRILKAVRRVNNYALADGGGFTSRQIVDNRLEGRTPIAVDDLARLAAGLRVDPHVLLLRTDEALRWVNDNPDYKSPRLRKQRKSAVKSDIMRARRQAQA